MIVTLAGDRRESMVDDACVRCKSIFSQRVNIDAGAN